MSESGLCSATEYSTRRVRRNAVKRIISSLENIRAAEQNYLDNVPENLENSESFDVGECAVDALDEIIGLLAEVY